MPGEAIDVKKFPEKVTKVKQNATLKYEQGDAMSYLHNLFKDGVIKFKGKNQAESEALYQELSTITAKNIGDIALKDVQRFEQIIAMLEVDQVLKSLSVTVDLDRCNGFDLMLFRTAGAALPTEFTLKPGSTLKQLGGWVERGLMAESEIQHILRLYLAPSATQKKHSSNLEKIRHDNPKEYEKTQAALELKVNDLWDTFEEEINHEIKLISLEAWSAKKEKIKLLKQGLELIKQRKYEILWENYKPGMKVEQLMLDWLLKPMDSAHGITNSMQDILNMKLTPFFKGDPYLRTQGRLNFTPSLVLNMKYKETALIDQNFSWVATLKDNVEHPPIAAEPRSSIDDCTATELKAYEAIIIADLEKLPLLKPFYESLDSYQEAYKKVYDKYVQVETKLKDLNQDLKFLKECWNDFKKLTTTDLQIGKGILSGTGKKENISDAVDALESKYVDVILENEEFKQKLAKGEEISEKEICNIWLNYAENKSSSSIQKLLAKTRFQFFSSATTSLDGVKKGIEGLQNGQTFSKEIQGYEPSRVESYNFSA